MAAGTADESLIELLVVADGGVGSDIDDDDDDDDDGLEATNSLLFAAVRGGGGGGGGGGVTFTDTSLDETEGFSLSVETFWGDVVGIGAGATGGGGLGGSAVSATLFDWLAC